MKDQGNHFQSFAIKEFILILNYLNLLHPNKHFWGYWVASTFESIKLTASSAFEFITKWIYIYFAVYKIKSSINILRSFFGIFWSLIIRLDIFTSEFSIIIHRLHRHRFKFDWILIDPFIFNTESLICNVVFLSK